MYFLKDILGNVLFIVICDWPPHHRITNRSEGFPLTGLFHPWAQWDLGLDTLENYSRLAAAATVVVAL